MKKGDFAGKVNLSFVFDSVDNLHISHDASGMGANIRVLVT